MQKEQQELANLIKGKKVAFIGAGVSHKTLIKEFVELGAHVTLCDQKKSVEDFGDYAATIKELGIDLSLGENYLDGFKGQDIIMRTPGFVGYFEKPLQDAMAAGTMVTSEVELFFQFCPCEIVAVTGSDGKTTTTTLISKFYEAAGRKVHLGGNIGAALLPMLPEVRPEDVAVVELSSFQLISMHQSPKIAVVTNVTPNHLDHHKDMQEYIDAKRNILLYQNPPCRAVLGYENDITRAMQSDCKGEQVWFTRLHETDRGAFLRESDDTLCYAENGVVTPILPRKEIQLRGLHNVENLLAACAALAGSGFFALLTQLPAADLPGLIPGYLVWLNDFSGTLASFSDTQVQLFPLFSQVGQGTFASLLGDLFSLPLLLWLTPYRRVAHAAFYDARQAMPEAAAQDLPPL